mgnify:CR=1 FL=1
MELVEWVFPKRLSEALEALRQDGSSVVAGGTTLLDLLKLAHPAPRRLVDITRLELDRISVEGDVLSIGALVSNAAAAESGIVRRDCPAVSEAILQGASGQIRNAASIGGNLLQATRCVYFRTPDWRCNMRVPGAGCEAMSAPEPSHAVLGCSDSCIAVNPSDMAVAMLALDAVVIAATAGGGPVRIPIADFYPLPGSTPHVTHRLPPGALITAVELPRSTLARHSGYLKLRGRASYEFATASVAAALRLEEGRVEQVAVAIGGLATRPWRRVDAESELVGRRLDPQAIDGFCDRLLEGADPRPVTRHKIPLARGAVHRMLTRLAEAHA